MWKAVKAKYRVIERFKDKYPIQEIEKIKSCFMIPIHSIRSMTLVGS